MLREYTRDNVNNTRIVLFSDGQENSQPFVADVLPGIISEKIVIDIILIE